MVIIALAVAIVLGVWAFIWGCGLEGSLDEALTREKASEALLSEANKNTRYWREKYEAVVKLVNGG